MTTLITEEARSGPGKRIPEGFKSVELDWYNEDTFQNPFEAGPFDAVYLLGPPDIMDPSKAMIPFIDLAVKKGVKRFVYLSAKLADEDDEGSEPGRLPKYLKERGLLTMYGPGIREKGEIVTAIPTARVPFVATEDIAQAAFEGSTSDVLGKKITHRPVSAEEMVPFCLQFMSEKVARCYVESELGVEKGSEEKWTTLSEEDQRKLKVKVVVGKTSVRDWVLKHRKEMFETTI
ncbi:NmrA family protein [Coprinopsis sp. MPI-PUGE-AT-0042]|nr:NmrA family protein [Coprinopsis sp. MPI-PUGE-AT-0042]